MKVEVKRSAIRTRTVSARLVDDTMILSIPACLSETEEYSLIDRMKRKLQEKKDRQVAGEHRRLNRMVRELNEKYLNNSAYPLSIQYSSRQKSIYGSCSFRSRNVRIARMAERFPEWVQKYLVLHELAHLIHPNHSRSFWDIVKLYPLFEKARGFLLGFAYGRKK